MDELKLRSVVVFELVRIVQPRQRIDEHPKKDGEREATALSAAREDPRQRLPLQVLHDDHRCAGLLVDLVCLYDVGVVEPRGEARLREEHRPKLRIAGEAALERFDDDELVEAARSPREREVDASHAPLAELGKEAVLPVPRRIAFEPRVHGSPPPKHATIVGRLFSPHNLARSGRASGRSRRQNVPPAVTAAPARSAVTSQKKRVAAGDGFGTSGRIANNTVAAASAATATPSPTSPIA